MREREKGRRGEEKREGESERGRERIIIKILEINFQKNNYSSFTKLTMMHLLYSKLKEDSNKIILIIAAKMMCNKS